MAPAHNVMPPKESHFLFSHFWNGPLVDGDGVPWYYSLWNFTFSLKFNSLLSPKMGIWHFIITMQNKQKKDDNEMKLGIWPSLLSLLAQAPPLSLGCWLLKIKSKLKNEIKVNLLLKSLCERCAKKVKGKVKDWVKSSSASPIRVLHCWQRIWRAKVNLF